MGFLDKLLGRKQDGAALYAAIVERARAPHWYEAGGVDDTIDGRFDMIAAILSLVLIRIERDTPPESPGDPIGVALAERFVDDMDPQLREIGIGDIIVGKHIGRMMSMLGGRLGAYREGLATNTLGDSLIRNLYRDQDPGPEALRHVEQALSRFNASFAATSLDDLSAGRLPQ